MYFLNERIICSFSGIKIIHKFKLKISFVNYTMVEMLRFLRNLHENCLEGFPSILKFYENMISRSNIASHLEQMTRQNQIKSNKRCTISIL
ncbi:hypothetical protein T4B_1823 [Trichinella pseudospiralis]|nr:hypothetical protein T4B_1823 [Trichinella pseudospiralis]